MDATITTKAMELAKELAGQATTVEELNDVMRQLMKSALERMLNTELDVHLGRRLGGPIALEDGTAFSSADVPAVSGRNRKNGSSPKTIQGDLGKIPLNRKPQGHSIFAKLDIHR
jgi:putative transposase